MRTEQQEAEAEFSERPTVLDPAGHLRVSHDRWQQLLRLERRLVEQKAAMSEIMYGDIVFRAEHRGPTVLSGEFLDRYDRILRVQGHIERRLDACARKGRR